MAKTKVLGKQAEGLVRGGPEAKAAGRFARLHARVGKLRIAKRVTAYRLGVALSVIKRDQLYKAGGFRSFDAYLVTIPGVSARTLYRYVSLADSVPSEVASKYDAPLIEQGLRLLKPGRGGAVVVSLAALEKIRVPAVRDGRTVTVGFANATPEELAAEADRVARAALPAATTEETEQVERVRRRLSAGPGALADVSTRRRGKRRVLVIEVPLDRLDEFDSLFR